MKELTHSYASKQSLFKIKGWIKLVSVTGAAQLVVQGTGLVSAIIIIHLLTTEEYAIYTLANTMLGTMGLLADAGISTGVMSQGSKVWTDRDKLGGVLATGLDLRRKFGVFSLLVSVPFLLYLLHHHGAGWFFSSLIVLALIPAYFAALSDSLLEIALKLHQDIPRLQKNQVVTGIGRLVLISLSLFVFPWTFVAILGNGIPRIWGNIRLRKIAGEYANFEQPGNPVVKKEVLAIVKRSLPEVIYYCLSGQITIWLISIFGSTTSIAQVGALGRLVMLMTLFTTVFSTLLVPRFARLRANSRVLFMRFAQILAVVISLCLVIIGLVYLFPGQLLWVLGKNYSGLNDLLVLNVVGGCLSLVSGISFSLYACRGWIMNPLLSIPFNLLVLVCGILLFDVSATKGVFMFNIFIGVMQALMHILYAVFKIRTVAHES